MIACQKPVQADLIVYNGIIYTMLSPMDTVSAMAIGEGHILETGIFSSLLKYKTPHTRLIDLQGRTVLPGFTDAHIHPLSGGLALLECDLTDLQSADQILDSLKNYADHHPNQAWIRGESMWLSAFKHGNPLKETLDAIIDDRPAYISSSDGHNAWVNSKALSLAGINRETPDPMHGRIERDPITREPTGTLRESAQDLVSHLIPKYSSEDRLDALEKGLMLANQQGITSLIEASASSEYIDSYFELEKLGRLTAPTNISIYGDISQGGKMVQEVIWLRKKYQSQTSAIKLNQVKLFMDGVVEGKTAAMLANYTDDHHKGIANTSPDTAMAIISALDKAGFQIHVHAIGDGAIRMTLDAFEQAQALNGIKDSRHHIAHLHVIHPDDYSRFKTLNVLANFQALWATLEDSYMTELNFPYLGKDRITWQYPIGTLHRAGATLVFGSDWNVSTQNPFAAIQVAVTRRGPDSVVRPAWTPHHLIDRYEVIKGYTINGAFVTFREKEIGSISAGKWADFIVLDQNVMRCDPFLIHKTKVLQTYFKGKIIYSAQDY